jgi:DNA-binding response OmpR family regulator
MMISFKKGILIGPWVSFDIQGEEMRSGRKKILIVEDECLIALSTRLSLEEMGFSVEGIALSGEAAVRMLAESLPDIVLMDIELSAPMDGIMTAKDIRKRSDVPVLFFSGNIDENSLRRMDVLNNWNYLSKPSDNTTLKQAITLYLGRAGGSTD